MPNPTQDSFMRPKSIQDSYENVAHDAGRKIGKVANEFMSKASSRIDSSRAYVRENPASGVAIAAATGAAVGSLLTMMLRSKRPQVL